MPYADKQAGIYLITNTITGSQYVGQSRFLKKRIQDHFNLLEAGRHPNSKLQRSFSKHGRLAFVCSIEVVCEDPSDLDEIERAFLTGEAEFNGKPCDYNFLKDPTGGRAGMPHSSETRNKISLSKIGNRSHVTAAYINKLSIAIRVGHLKRPEYAKAVLAMIQNRHLRNCELSSLVNKDPSTTLKLSKKWRQLVDSGKISQELIEQYASHC